MIDTIRSTRLKNGLTIITDKMDGVRSTTLGFFFRVGARNEPRELHGISHFIEHAVFKGTPRRTSLDIARLQDRLGGNMDAFTSHEETGFAIKVIDDRLEQAFDLIADMLVNPLFDERDLRAEQKVIVEEMKMVDDSPEDYLGEIFSEAFYPGHPLGRNIAGTPKTVRSFDHKVTKKYHSDIFNASNLVITAAGNVEHKRLVDMARKQFSTVAGPTGPARSSIKPPVASDPILIEKSKGLEQAHLIVAAPMVGAADNRRYAADLLSNIIGGGTSSRLWQTVREERGLAYSVGASVVMYQDCGLFSIMAATSPGQVAKVVDLSVAEMRAVASDGVTKDELDLAKDQTVASILLGLEDSAARAATLAQSEMVHGRQIRLDETLKNLAAVTPEDIHALARESFQTEKIAFAALGDLKGLKITRKTLAI